MICYLVRRIILIITTFIGITVVCFFITLMFPGGPVEQAISHMVSGNKDRLSRLKDSSEKEKLNITYGYEKPVLKQYFHWLSGIITGNFGRSFQTNRPVFLVISERIPISLFFGLTGFILAYLICIPLGYTRALHHNKLLDKLSNIIVYIGYVIPGFALGILLLVLFRDVSFFNVFPLGDAVSHNYESVPWYNKLFNSIHHMILPVMCYTITGLGILTAHMKKSVMKELKKKYIETALAKGLAYKKIIFRHVLPNALIPILAGLGSFFTVFFAGSILIEKIFNIPGIGYLAFDSIIKRDYPVVIGLIIIQSLLNLAVRFVSDISIAAADPRIRLEAGANNYV